MLTGHSSLFDRLYEHTSNETTERSPYANTRSRDGVYAITSTESGESTYAAGEFDADQPYSTGSNRDETPFDCAETCPTCDPNAVDTV